MEDYKKKYEETIEKVKELYLCQLVDTNIKTHLLETFPELEEYSDERTKIELIGFIKSRLAGLPDCKRFSDWVEKHGEEQSIDNTEPKFNVGDWIISEDKGVHKDYAVCKIVKIEGDKYSIEIGGYLDKTTLEQYEYRLWTIQDARAGDILKASDESLFIYNGEITASEGAGFYVACTTDGHISSDNNYGWEYKDRCQPSTQKEQEFLLSKIEEAGHKWDADTLELKKIEEKSTKPLKGEDYGIDGLYCAFDILKKTLGNVDGYQTDDGILEHEIAIDTIKALYEKKIG